MVRLFPGSKKTAQPHPPGGAVWPAPDYRPSQPPSLLEAQAYCRRLARSHYENFTVASFLLPRRLRQHFFNIYAYCRMADDLADETGDPEQNTERLGEWEDALRACYRGEAEHPVFVALRQTIDQFDIPPEPFHDLLVAFRQDQRAIRYASFDDLLGYCRNSACPVGRLVLYLGRCHRPELLELSDSVCIGLQLANFWQDVARDYDLGRVYLPQDVCRHHGYDEAMFARRESNDAFRCVLHAEVDRAEEFLRAGLPLAEQVPSELRVDVALFARGGLAVLDAIRRIDYDVWRVRPTVSRRMQLRLLARCWWQGRWAARRGGGL